MSYTVTIHPSQHQFQVEESETILEAAMRHNIDLPYGCRGGACGSCAGYLVEGEVYYDDEPMALDDEMTAAGMALFCQAKTHMDLDISIEEIEKLSQIQVRQLSCHVSSKEKRCHDVIALRISLDNNERLQYLAGQYIEFILEDGKRRAFSIANAPHNDNFLELHIRHVDGGVFSDFLFASMPEHSALQIEGPLGSFFIREDRQRPIIMMGGGTGFGPLKAMIEHIEYVNYQQPVHLFMGVRALRDLYMQDTVQQWLEKNPQLTFTAVLSEPLADDNWQGESGFVHESVARHYPDLSGFDIYMSGPPAMINAAAMLFTQQGASKDAMFSDAFEYSSDAMQAISAKKA